MKSYWARLHYAGTFKRWHLFEDGAPVSACERQSFGYPRAERHDGPDPPRHGKVCRYCLAIADKQARRTARAAHPESLVTPKSNPRGPS